MQRRLVAILATDVVGYSRLMEHDEEGTHTALKERRTAIVEPTIERYNGTVVKLTGDGALVEFPSVVMALRSAIAIQRQNESRNAGLADDKRIHLRMGINLGDVLSEEGDIFGTGVNIAARLQSIAAPGGICASAAAVEQAQGHADLTFLYRGREQLRNIREPVNVYDVTGLDLDRPVAPPKRGLPGVIGDRPSLAILPFQNLGEDAVQRYFCDGITRDLITELSRFRSLFVVSANSSFQFRDSGGDRLRVGRELGVRYLGDGSIQRVGRQLRISAELIDADSGIQIWGERYSHNVEDPTAIQETLAQSIAARVHNRLQDAEIRLAKRKPPKGLQSYDLWLQGIEHHESNAADGYARARELYARAIELDPSFARAYASLAELAYMESALSNWGQEGKDDCAEAAALAQRAAALDKEDANGHAVLGWVHMVRREFGKAVRHWDLATELNPNDADIMMWRATALTFLGKPEEGAECAQTAMRLNPLHPDWYLSDYAVVLFFCQRFREMQALYDVIPELFVHTPGWRAASYAQLGMMTEARDRAAAFVRNIERIWTGKPEAGPSDFGRWFVNCIPLRRQAERDTMEAGLRLAGLLD